MNSSAMASLLAEEDIERKPRSLESSSGQQSVYDRQQQQQQQQQQQWQQQQQQPRAAQYQQEQERQERQELRGQHQQDPFAQQLQQAAQYRQQEERLQQQQQMLELELSGLRRAQQAEDHQQPQRSTWNGTQPFSSPPPPPPPAWVPQPQQARPGTRPTFGGGARRSEYETESQRFGTPLTTPPRTPIASERNQMAREAAWGDARASHIARSEPMTPPGQSRVRSSRGHTYEVGNPMALPLTPSEQSAIAAANPFEVHRARQSLPTAGSRHTPPGSQRHLHSQRQLHPNEQRAMEYQQRHAQESQRGRGPLETDAHRAAHERRGGTPRSQMGQLSRATPPTSGRASHVRGTALEQSYKAHVGGVKMGYSGHVPGGRDHFGSAHVGGSMEEYGTVQQRHHHVHPGAEHSQADKSMSHLAAASIAGYQGHKPDQHSDVGESYWSGPGASASILDYTA